MSDKEKSTGEFPGEKLRKEDLVPEDIRNAILENVSRPELELVDWEANPATSAGENFGSAIHAVKLYLRNTITGKSETVSVMLKSLPREETLVSRINEINAFVKDIYFYERIAPDMETFQRRAGIPEEQIASYWANVFASRINGKSDYLAMENLKSVGFRMANRKQGMDFEHSKLVLEALARFHAVSYAMFGGKFEMILEKFPWLREIMYDQQKVPSSMKKMIQETFGHIADTLRKEGEEGGALNVEKIYDENYFSILHELTGGKVKWAVIGHGDCWSNNVLFRYDEESGKPVEVKLVDYQLSRASSRAVDINYFLYSGPQVKVLNEREEELKEIYFDEFTNFARKLGVDTEGEELTKENFLWEVDHFRFFGCVTGLLIALMTPSAEKSIEKDSAEETAIDRMKNMAIHHLPKCVQMKNRMQL